MKESEMIFGLRSVIEAVQSGKEVDRILLKKGLQGDLARELLDTVRGRFIPVQYVPQERLDRITRKNHQGVIAFIAAVAYQRLDDLIPFLYEQGRDPFILLLDGVTDVRNFGAIARTCACAGIDAIVIPSSGSVSVTADAMKTSAGALNHLPVCKERSINGAIRFLRQSGLQVVVASEKAAELYTDIPYCGPLAIVMGGEDTGVAADNLRIADHIVRIPQRGAINSLNVSAAAAIILYEALRQKSVPPSAER